MGRKEKDSSVFWSKNGRVGARAKVITSTQSPNPENVVWVDVKADQPVLVDGGLKAILLTWPFLKKAGKLIYSLRRFFLAFPVVFAALRLAAEAMKTLPEIVSFGGATVDEAQNLLITSYTVTREFAVYAPLSLTGFCILMMFLSRRVVYPWVISIMTLLLPVVLMLTNGLGR